MSPKAGSDGPCFPKSFFFFKHVHSLMQDFNVSFRTKHWWKIQSMRNSGKGMWKNLPDKEMWNHLWRKLLCRSQIGVSAFQTSNCRRENRVVNYSVGLNQCSLKLRNIQDFLALYIYGKWVHLYLFSQLPLCCFIHINTQ